MWSWIERALALFDREISNTSDMCHNKCAYDSNDSLLYIMNLSVM